MREKAMYRSVQESESQGGGLRKVFHWVEGLVIGAAVAVGFVYVFGLLLY